ncbi:MAG: hypothetical protein K9W44_03095 [Candidatus Lokiarchaeota archaeon]|nr:hypothetical protein [Candidatus Harpocratesius repetitus]
MMWIEINMDLTLYVKHDDDFVETEKVKPNELSLVLDKDKKEIFVYRPKDQIIYDEYESEELYNQILNKFLNPNIILLSNLKPSENETEQIQKIKEFILAAQPSPFLFKIGNFFQNLFLFRKIRRNIEIFQNYQQSGVWRRRLSNQTNLRKLSIFNVILSLIISIISILIIFLAIKPIYYSHFSIESLQFWLENLTIYEGLIFFFSLVLLFVNFIFVLFPLKFPIKPKKYSQLK